MINIINNNNDWFSLIVQQKRFLTKLRLFFSPPRWLCSSGRGSFQPTLSSPWRKGPVKQASPDLR